MNVTEIKKALKSKKKPELEEIILTLYKNIPPKKIAESGIDQIFVLSQVLPKVAIDNTIETEKKLINEINTFYSHFIAGHYGIPNRIIPKAKRSKWRFVVMGFYKEMASIFPEASLKKELAMAFGQLYDAMTEGCNHYLTSSQECFTSIQKTQITFYAQVVNYKMQVLSGEELYKQLIEHIIDSGMSYDTDSLDLFEVIASSFPSPMAMEDIIKINKIYCDQAYDKYMELRKKNKYTSFSDVEKLVEGTALLLLKLQENDAAKSVFYHYDKMYSDKEMMYYLMVRIFNRYCNHPEKEILNILNKAKEEKVVLRDKLAILHANLTSNPSFNISNQYF